MEDLLQRVATEFEDVDEVWHAGDWQQEEVLDGLKALGKPLSVVNGNAPDDARYPERILRDLEGLRVGMVHRPPLPGDAWAETLDICIHGHTHRWRDEVKGQTRFINVSTATAAFPTRDRTIGILSLEGKRATLRRIRLG